MPTYNCAPMMERHLEAMCLWADLAEEIIVVDSRSTDGTLDIIRGRLRHPNLRVILRDRGLYESWNEGIAATTGDWIYVSTAGDTIERAQLLKLMRTGIEAEADVIISPCHFVDEDGKKLPGSALRNPEILRGTKGGAFLLAPTDVRDHISLGARVRGFLGSWASDLFRGDFLRARPLPVEYVTHGDSAWALRHAHEMRLCVVPEIGSTFCFHRREPAESKPCLAEVFDRIYATEIRRGGHLPGLALSLKVRAWRARRRQLMGKGRFLQGLWANLTWLFLRVLLSVTQAPRNLRRYGAAKPLSAKAG
jgi:glycosyltransferase involved in cell wall biosynthesis